MTDNAGNTDLFNPGSTDDKSSDLFSGNTGTSTVVEDKRYLDELVGEGKKYSDPEALAKSRIHADNHISQLEKDNEELRQELQKRLGVEEVYERIRQERKETPEPTNQEPTTFSGEQTSSTPEISLSDVKSLVQQAVNEHISVGQQASNKEFVMAELQKRLGDNYQTVMRDRAKALGESTEDLSALAMSKPKMFLELMAPQTGRPHQPDPGVPRTHTNSGAPAGSMVRNEAYYANMRKTDPQRYHSKAVRVQMMNDAIQLGDAYFNNN